MPLNYLLCFQFLEIFLMRSDVFRLYSRAMLATLKGYLVGSTIITKHKINYYFKSITARTKDVTNIITISTVFNTSCVETTLSGTIPRLAYRECTGH